MTRIGAERKDARMRQDKGRQETSYGRVRMLEEAVGGSLGESADKGNVKES